MALRRVVLNNCRQLQWIKTTKLLAGQRCACMSMCVYAFAYLSIHLALLCFYLRIGIALAAALTVCPLLLASLICWSLERRARKAEEDALYLPLKRNKWQEALKMLIRSLSCHSKTQEGLCKEEERPLQKDSNSKKDTERTELLWSYVKFRIQIHNVKLNRKTYWWSLIHSILKHNFVKKRKLRGKFKSGCVKYFGRQTFI